MNDCITIAHRLPSFCVTEDPQIRLCTDGSRMFRTKGVIWYMLAYTLLINLPCIIAQRYNRPRIKKLLKRISSHARPSMDSVVQRWVCNWRDLHPWPSLEIPQWISTTMVRFLIFRELYLYRISLTNWAIPKRDDPWLLYFPMYFFIFTRYTKDGGFISPEIT